MTTPSTNTRTANSQVTVEVDPHTAFTIFVDEIDLWWVRGPINFHDAARAIGMRCEHGAGGRLLELYAADGSEALELGRITGWEPGRLLAWKSSVDDVTVEVRFDAATDGTTVSVTATVPAGGTDAGGTAWVRVVPRWLGNWVARRDHAARSPAETSRLALAIYYRQPGRAARWLADAFGLALTLDIDADDNGGWIELRAGHSPIMVFRREEALPESHPVTHIPWVYVDDLDQHLKHARDCGAAIVSDIHQHGYRAYEAADLEGNHWTFAQARPAMAEATG